MPSYFLSKEMGMHICEKMTVLSALFISKLSQPNLRCMCVEYISSESYAAVQMQQIDKNDAAFDFFTAYKNDPYRTRKWYWKTTEDSASTPMPVSSRPQQWAHGDICTKFTIGCYT